MTQPVRTIEKARTNMKPDLKYSGIVFILVTMQTDIAKDTVESVKETFGKHMNRISISPGFLIFHTWSVHL